MEEHYSLCEPCKRASLSQSSSCDECQKRILAIQESIRLKSVVRVIPSEQSGPLTSEWTGEESVPSIYLLTSLISTMGKDRKPIDSIIKKEDPSTGDLTSLISTMGKDRKPIDSIIKKEDPSTGDQPAPLTSQLQSSSNQSSSTRKLKEKRRLKCFDKFKKKINVTFHHSRYHSALRPYSCTKCSRNFKRVEQLMKHKLFHAGQTTFTEVPVFWCLHCKDKFFYKQGELIAHNKEIHDPPCPFFDDILAVEAAVKENVRKRTGNRPYCCFICGLRFADSLKLHHHLFIEHCSMK